MAVHFACNLACMHAVEQVIVKSTYMYLKVYCCIPLIFVYTCKFIKCLLLICKVAHNIFQSVIKLDDLRHALRYFITLTCKCLIFSVCEMFFMLILFSSI